MFELIYDFMIDTVLFYGGDRFDHYADLFESVAVIFTFAAVGGVVFGITAIGFWAFKWASNLGRY